jgi:hypothetical protein
MSLGQRAGSQQQHGSHRAVAEATADTGGMAPQQADLESGRLFGVDVGGRQATKPGGDAVDGAIFGYHLFDEAASRCHSVCHIRPEAHLSPTVGYLDDIADLERSAIDGHNPQRSSSIAATEH